MQILALLLALFGLSALHAEPVPLTYIGMHMHRADQGTVWPKGVFGSWRLWDAYVGWKNLEPARGKWDFSKLDRYLGMAKLTGVEILLPLGVTPQWASARPDEKGAYGNGTAAEAAQLADWENYVRTVATRYKGRIRHFEIWNEVNEKGFYSGSMAKLTELTCVAYRVIKSVDPESRLVSPSMVGEGREPELFGDMLKGGVANCIDIVGYHFYELKTEPEKLLPLVDRVRASMQRAGVGSLPLWNTEYGWYVDNRDGLKGVVDARWRRLRQDELASFVVRGLILGRAARIERFYWYAWDNETMGMLEADGSRKAGSFAFELVRDWLAAGDVQSCRESAGRWMCGMAAAVGVRRYVLWMAGKAAGVFVPPKGERLVEVRRLNGSILAGAELYSVAELPLSNEPVLITTVLK